MSMHYSRTPYRGGSVVRASSTYRETSPQRAFSQVRASSVDRFAERYDRKLESDVQRSYSRAPSQVRTRVTYNYDGLPTYTSVYRPYNYWRLMNPSPFAPVSSIVRDPWWYNVKGLRPPTLPSYYQSPSYLRTSYLSPVKSRYLWYSKPLRPFSYHAWV